MGEQQNKNNDQKPNVKKADIFVKSGVRGESDSEDANASYETSHGVS